MIIDNCWRCKGTARPEEIEKGRFRIRCQGCNSVGLSSTDPRMAATLWNDAQREERRILTDTELLQDRPPGAGDKLREDSP